MSAWFEGLLLFAMFLLSIGLLLALARVILGPTRPDRVIALELCSLLSVGLATLQAMHSGDTSQLAPATLLALLSFLGTVGLARYLERFVRSK